MTISKNKSTYSKERQLLPMQDLEKINKNEIWIENEKYWVMVSNFGRVLSCYPNPKHRPGKITFGTKKLHGDGYRYSQRVIDRSTGKCCHKPIHHLVVHCFFPGFGSMDKNMLVRHLDGNKLNNTPENLKIITRSFSQLNKVRNTYTTTRLDSCPFYFNKFMIVHYLKMSTHVLISLADINTGINE